MLTQSQRLEIIVEARVRQAMRELSGLKGQFEGIAQALTGVAGQAAGMAGFAGIMASSYGIARGIVQATSAMEGFRARLTTVLGTQEKVNKQLAFLSDFARKTPYELNEVIDAFTRMSSYGLQPTEERFRIIGDFAASMSRSFTDAVEAVADASRGEFERMREFGLTKEQVASFGKNLITAGGQVKDFTGLVTALFKAMESRSKGAMERLQNTIVGKWSNLKDQIFRTYVALGEGLKTPIGNFIFILTKLLENLANPGRLKTMSDWLTKVFSVEHMKQFAKILGTVALRIKDLFSGDFMDAMTIVHSRFQSFILMIEQGFKRLFASFENLSKGIGAALENFNPLHPGNTFRMIGAAFKAAGQTSTLQGTIDAAMQVIVNAPAEAAERRIRERAQRRRGTLGFIDSLFSGLSDRNIPPTDAFGATFGTQGPTARDTGLSKIADLILGGGELGRLGVKATELGRGISPTDRTIHVDATGVESHLRRFVEIVAERTLADAIRKGVVQPATGR